MNLLNWTSMSSYLDALSVPPGETIELLNDYMSLRGTQRKARHGAAQAAQADDAPCCTLMMHNDSKLQATLALNCK